jgi:cell division septation protein DedD
MKFLLVLSDAFDALRAYRIRVALGLSGIVIVAVLIAAYLARSGGQRAAPRPALAHSTSAVGRVERANPVSALLAKPEPAAPERTAAPPAQTTPAPTSVPRIAQAPAPVPAPAAASTPAPQPPRAAPAPALSYRVQVGAFRDVALARGLSKRLTQAGFPTALDQGTTSDGTAIYRVRTKQAFAKNEALQLVTRIRRREPALRPFLVEDARNR